MKMSNRFLVGVPDLLCQLPGYQTSFWEVKSSTKLYERGDSNLTPPQKKWLRTLEEHGGFGGVIHFALTPSGLAVTIRPTSTFPYREDLKTTRWWVYKKDLVALPHGCKMKPFQDLMLRLHEERKHADRSNNGNDAANWDPCGYKG